MTLTPRQTDVANLLLAGMHPEEMGATLGIHPEVVKHHLKLMYEKYGIKSGIKIVKLAVALYYERHPEARV
jgi:DNA-binding CsgD family transcriptional regulator